MQENEGLFSNDHVQPAYTAIDGANSFVKGYLGNWVKKNISYELLEFPIEQYLWP